MDYGAFSKVYKGISIKNPINEVIIKQEEHGTNFLCKEYRMMKFLKKQYPDIQIPEVY